MAVRQLGRFVRQYDTDIRARRMRVIRALGAGVLWSAAATVLIIRAFDTSNVVFAFGGMLFGPAMLCMASGITRWERIAGIRQERVKLYERGIIALLDDDSMVVRWGDIGKVDQRGHRASPLLRMMGVDTQYIVCLNDGRTLWFDSNTSDSEELVDAISAATRARQESDGQ